MSNRVGDIFPMIFRRGMRSAPGGFLFFHPHVIHGHMNRVGRVLIKCGGGRVVDAKGRRRA